MTRLKADHTEISPNPLSPSFTHCESELKECQGHEGGKKSQMDGLKQVAAGRAGGANTLSSVPCEEYRDWWESTHLSFFLLLPSFLLPLQSCLRVEHHQEREEKLATSSPTRRNFWND